MFDRLGMAIRLRDPWEAVDLGFILLRTHWRPVLARLAGRDAPLSRWPSSLLFWNQLWVPPLVIWWLKPALDRVVLHVLAKATFGEVPGLPGDPAARPEVPAPGPRWPPCSGAGFSPQRSFVLPVWQLEEQPGMASGSAARSCCARGRTQAIFLTFVCLAVPRSWSSVSVLAALALFTPTGSDFELMAAVFGSGSERVALGGRPAEPAAHPRRSRCWSPSTWPAGSPST